MGHGGFILGGGDQDKQCLSLSRYCSCKIYWSKVTVRLGVATAHDCMDIDREGDDDKTT